MANFGREENFEPPQLYSHLFENSARKIYYQNDNETTLARIFSRAQRNR